jgi:hypothetical protein
MNPLLAPVAAALAAGTPPWFAPYETLLRACVGLPGTWSVAEALNRLAAGRSPQLAAGPLRFVPQTALPEGEAYEAFIARTARVPTRDNLHDFFNGLVWLRFPALKRRLNELQAQAIARDGIGAVRGPVRDALTLFDENAAWLHAPPALEAALRLHDWHSAFVSERPAWREAQVVCFGHALLEKLLAPRKNLTAHAWPVPPGAPAADWLVAQLTPERLAAKPHLALPVLGVPGWWPANEAPAFYDDASVFRPRRAQVRLSRAPTS